MTTAFLGWTRPQAVTHFLMAALNGRHADSIMLCAAGSTQESSTTAALPFMTGSARSSAGLLASAASAHRSATGLPVRSWLADAENWRPGIPLPRYGHVPRVRVTAAHTRARKQVDGGFHAHTSQENLILHGLQLLRLCEILGLTFMYMMSTALSLQQP